MKIMVVDDDPDIRMIVSGGLKALGHEIVACESGEEAWKILETNAFPLLITDWLMPKIDGLQLTKLARRAKSGSYTYVIMLTAKGKREDYLTAVKAGVDAFISKPLDGAVLEAQVRIATRIIGLQTRTMKLEAIIKQHGIAIDGA